MHGLISGDECLGFIAMSGVLANFSLDDAVILGGLANCTCEDALALAAEAGQAEPDAGPPPKIGRFHPCVQRARATLRWERSRHCGAGKQSPELTLHVLQHNHLFATREDDAIPLPGSTHNHKGVSGSGAWKQITARAVLRAAFDTPAATAVETAKKFVRSSSRHITDAMYTVCSCLLTSQKLHLSELFTPAEKHAWLIQDFSSDEASFRLAI